MAIVPKFLRRRDDAPEKRGWIDSYIANYILPAMEQFTYNSHPYQVGGLYQNQLAVRTQEIAQSLPGYTAALRQCPPAFAAQLQRALTLSQVRFTFRNPPYGPAPRKVFGGRELLRLERPWPNATTGELVSRMEWHAGVAGNSFVFGGDPKRLRVLRPDWTAIVYGSDREPEDPMHALDGEVIGYIYQNGGLASGGSIRTLRPEDVAHWSPIPDPESPGLGMSWITPGIRALRGHIAASEHKLRFFANGATPNLVIKGIQETDPEKFNELVDMMEQKHKGLGNAYRTLYLTAGSDATVVGSTLREMDFTATQGRDETLLSVLSRIPAPILGISEGLAGSSLNAGNLGVARRLWADNWIYPTLEDVCRALTPLVTFPKNGQDAELWFDTADMPILREDAKDAAEIEQIKAQTIGGLVKDGFTPESSIQAVMGQDMRLLKPIPGWVSVQLQQKTPAAPQESPQSQPDQQPPPTRGEIHIHPGEVMTEALDSLGERMERTGEAIAASAAAISDVTDRVQNQLEGHRVKAEAAEQRAEKNAAKADKAAERAEKAAFGAEEARTVIGRRVSELPAPSATQLRSALKKAKVTFEYDRQGRIIAGKTADGRRIVVDYDRNGAVIGAHED